MKKIVLALLILLLASSVYAAKSMTFTSDSSGNYVGALFPKSQANCSTETVNGQICTDSDTAPYRTCKGNGTSCVPIGGSYIFAGVPTSTDDSGDGYGIGDEWNDSTTACKWVAKDVTPTAAVWINQCRPPLTQNYWLIGNASGFAEASNILPAISQLDISSGWMKIPNGTNPTIDAAGKVAIDTTAGQIKYYDSAMKILDPRHVENATFKTPVSGDKAKFKKPFGMTIMAISCVTDAATSAVLDVQECDTNGTNCATILSATATCTTTNQNIPPTTGSPHIDDITIAANNYIFISIGTITGTPGFLYTGIEYTVIGE